MLSLNTGCKHRSSPCTGRRSDPTDWPKLLIKRYLHCAPMKVSPIQVMKRNTYRYAGYFCNWFHFFDTTNRNFRYPKGAGDVGPGWAASCCFQSTTLVRAKLARRTQPESTRLTQPRSGRNTQDPVASLVDANVAAVAENHFIAFFRIGLESNNNWKSYIT